MGTNTWHIRMWYSMWQYTQVMYNKYTIMEACYHATNQSQTYCTWFKYLQVKYYTDLTCTNIFIILTCTIFWHTIQTYTWPKPTSYSTAYCIGIVLQDCTVLFPLQWSTILSSIDIFLSSIFMVLSLVGLFTYRFDLKYYWFKNLQVHINE